MEKWKSQIDTKDKFFQRSYLRPLFVDLRCPECNKLYRVDTRDIISDDPHFDCIQCGVTFQVEGHQQDPRQLVTRSAKKHVTFNLHEQSLSPEAIRKCPKCGASNLRSQSECGKCGLIFAKFEKYEKEGGVLPSLSRAWTDLMQDYNNLAKHFAFVDQCADMQAVPYALKKYQELKELQPFDPIATKMHSQVLLKGFSRRTVQNFESQLKNNQQYQNFLSLMVKVQWGQILNGLTWALPLVFIVWGFFSIYERNLIGFGVALIFLRLAFWLFWSGNLKH